VGLERGQTQVAEYFGGNCGYRRCPTGNDPRTPSVDETDCNGTLAPGGYGIGKVKTSSERLLRLYGIVVLEMCSLHMHCALFVFHLRLLFVAPS